MSIRHLVLAGIASVALSGTALAGNTVMTQIKPLNLSIVKPTAPIVRSVPHGPNSSPAKPRTVTEEFPFLVTKLSPYYAR
jgi:hypothetical protein